MSDDLAIALAALGLALDIIEQPGTKRAPDEPARLRAIHTKLTRLTRVTRKEIHK